jgi:hypothetical protein
MLTDVKKITEYLKKLGVTEGFTIRTDERELGIVDTSANTGITYTEPLQVQFGRIGGHFSVTGEEKSANVPVLSFKGFPHTVTGCFSLYGSDFRNMAGIEHELKYVGDDIVLNHDSTNILGLLTIGGEGKFDIDRGPVDKIMNKYREHGDSISAQDELLDAGLKAQAS